MSKLRFRAFAWRCTDPETGATLLVKPMVRLDDRVEWWWEVRFPGEVGCRGGAVPSARHARARAHDVFIAERAKRAR